MLNFLNQKNSGTRPAMKPNGQPVWFVAVFGGVLTGFCQVTVDSAEITYHGEAE